MNVKLSIWLAAAMCVGSVSAEAQNLRRSYEPTAGTALRAGPSTATSNSNSQATASTASQGGAAQGVGS